MGRLIHAVLLRRFRMLRKSGSLITIVFAVSTLLFAQNTKAASTDTAFDGTWSVTVNYHEYKNPDGSVALATVKGSNLNIQDITRGMSEAIWDEKKEMTRTKSRKKLSSPLRCY
jgi:hypothetical protein